MTDTDKIEILEKNFRKELQTLLNKYNAEIEASDHREARIIAHLNGVYDEKGNFIQPYVAIDFGSSIYAEK